MIQWLPRIERGFVRTWFTEIRADYYETLDGENWMAEDLRYRQSTHRQIAVKFTYLIQP